jgi:hypothetical protein
VNANSTADTHLYGEASPLPKSLTNHETWARAVASDEDRRAHVTSRYLSRNEHVSIPAHAGSTKSPRLNTHTQHRRLWESVRCIMGRIPAPFICCYCSVGGLQKEISHGNIFKHDRARIRDRLSVREVLEATDHTIRSLVRNQSA